MNYPFAEMEQEAARQLAEFRARRAAGSLTVEAVSQPAQRAASDFIAYYLATGGYLADAVVLLCEATSLKEPSLARAGLDALFPALIERLNDAFEPAYCDLYDRLFTQVIEFYRRLPEAAPFDAKLHRFDLKDAADLLQRKTRLREPRQASRRELRTVKRVLLLSRVTLGADVAITSILMARLREVLPAAEFVLLGSAKLQQLFGGDARVRIRQVHYERGGGVVSRLDSWRHLVAAVNEERRGLGPDEVWVIDPDSRLTQLGLLPVMEQESRYLFFESRSYRQPGVEQLGPLAEHWLNECIGVSGEAFPYLALPQELRAWGDTVCRKLRRGGARYLVSLSFGVGGNPRKRLPDSFEEALVRHLLTEAVLIVDKGGSEEERGQINRLIEVVKAQDKVLVAVREDNAAAVLQAEALRADLLTWDGGIGAFAALVAGSDQYIGYDSAGQHIAAALGVPTLTIFATTGSPLFGQRWRPYGPGPIQVLSFDPSRPASATDLLNDTLPQALALHQSLRDREEIRTPDSGLRTPDSKNSA